MRFIYFFIESYLLLSLAAGSLAAITTLQLGLTLHVIPIPPVVFFATFLFYNINRIRASWSLQVGSLPGVRMSNRVTLFNLLVLVSFVGMVVSVPYLNTEVLLMFCLLAFTSLLYSFPAFKGISNGISLRRIPYLKIFLITGIWSAVTVLLPALQSDFGPEKSEVTFVFLERFIFLFVIALLFDIRDMRWDQVSGLKTIPLKLGRERAMQLANSLLLVFLIIIILNYKSSLHFVLVSFIVSALSTFVLINHRNINTNPYFHRGMVDGMLLIQPLLVIIFYYLEKWI